MSPKDLSRQIYDRTDEVINGTEHNLRIHRSRGLHRRLRAFVDDHCDLLISDFASYPQSTNASVIGASIHLLTVLQDVMWSTQYIPQNHDQLLAHVWCGMDSFASEMTATEASSALYGFHCFKDCLTHLRPKNGVLSTLPVKSSRQAYSHSGLAKTLVEQFMTSIEMATTQDAISVLLGMASVYLRNEETIETILKTHILPQIPLLDHESLSNLSLALGLLKIDHPNRVFQPLIARFRGLKDVDYHNMEIDVFANVLYGAAQMKVKGNKQLALKLIRYLDRPHQRIWKPKTISQLAWSVGKLDSHNPTFIGTILKETIRSGQYFNQSEIRILQEAIDEMNVEPSDEVWNSLATKSLTKKEALDEF